MPAPAESEAEEADLLDELVAAGRGPTIAKFERPEEVQKRAVATAREREDLLDELTRETRRRIERQGAVPVGVEARIAEEYRAAPIPAEPADLLTSFVQATQPRRIREDARVTLAELQRDAALDLAVRTPGLRPAATAAKAIGIPGAAPIAEELEQRARQFMRSDLQLALDTAKLVEPLTASGLASRLLGTENPEKAAITKAERLIKHAAPVQPGDVGVALESPAMAGVRFAGTAAPAAIQEAAFALPVTALRKEGRAVSGTTLAQDFVSRLLEGETPATALKETLAGVDYGFTRLEDALLGTTPADRGLYSDRSLETKGALTRPLYQALYKTELGYGFGEDFKATAAVRGMSPGQQAAAFGAGFAADLLIPWELPATKALKVARVASAANDLSRAFGAVGDLPSGQILAALLRERPQAPAKVVGDMVAARLAAGERPADVLGAFDAPTADLIKQMLDEEGAIGVVERGPPQPPQAPPLATPGNELAAALGGTRAAAARAEEEVAGRFRSAVASAHDQARGGIAVAAEELDAARRRASDDLQLPPPLPRSSTEWRAQRAAELQKATDPAEIPEGYRGARGEAGEVLRWLNPEQSPATPLYRLVDADGKTVGRGDLQRVLSSMLSRQRYRDEVWFADHRPVSHWRRRAKADDPGRPLGSLAVDHDFVLPEEALFIDELRRGPRGKIPEQALIEQGAIDLHGAGLADGVVRRMVRSFFGDDVRRLPRRPLDEGQRTFVRAVEDATEARIRGHIGTDLVPLTATVRVTPAERDMILARLRREQKSAGYDPGRATVKDGIVEFADRAAADRFFRGHGIRLPDRPTTAEVREAAARVLYRLAGRATDVRWAIRGTPALSTALLSAAAATRPDLLLQGGASFLTRLVPEGRLAALPEETRRIFSAVLRDAESTGVSVLQEARRRIDAGVRAEDVLPDLLEEYRPVPAREGALVEALTGEPPNTLPALLAARRAILRETRDPAVIGRLAEAKTQPVLADATADYVNHRTRDMVREGRRVLEAMFSDEAAGRIFSRDSRILHNEQLVQVYHGFLRQGPAAPEVTHAFGQIAPGLAPARTERIYQRLLILYRRAQLEKEIAARLVEAQIGAADPRTQNAVLRVLRREDLRDFTLGERALAANMVRRVGLEPGAPVEFAKFRGVLLPRGLEMELRAAIDRGSRLGKDSITSAAFSWIYGLYKDALTTFNPRYLVSNVIGIPFMALETIGGDGLLRAVSSLGQHPAMAWELVRRASGNPAHRAPRLDARVFTTDAGQVYTADELERLVARYGVANTYQQQITARQLGEEMARLSGQWNVLGRVRLRGAPAKARLLAAETREALKQVAEIPERGFRVGVWLSELKRGTAPEAAAQVARDAAFDYSRLTDTDRAIARWGLVFWAFHRKNLDAFFTQLADNPHRLGRQLRLARDQRKAWGELRGTPMDPVTLSQQRSSDLGRLVLDRIGTPSGSDWTVSTSGVLTPVEGLLLFLQLLALFPSDLKRSRAAATAISGQIHPLLGTAVETLTDVDPGTGYRASAPLSNVIPTWMVETPGVAEFVQWAFAPRQEPLPFSAIHRAAGILPDGTPYAWVPDEQATQSWRIFAAMAPRVTEQTIPDTLTAAAGMFRDLGIDYMQAEQGRLDPRASTPIDLLSLLFHVGRVRGPIEQATALRSAEARELRGRIERERETR